MSEDTDLYDYYRSRRAVRWDEATAPTPPGEPSFTSPPTFEPLQGQGTNWAGHYVSPPQHDDTAEGGLMQPKYFSKLGSEHLSGGDRPGEHIHTLDSSASTAGMMQRWVRCPNSSYSSWPPGSSVTAGLSAAQFEPRGLEQMSYDQCAGDLAMEAIAPGAEETRVFASSGLRMQLSAVPDGPGLTMPSEPTPPRERGRFPLADSPSAGEIFVPVEWLHGDYWNALSKGSQTARSQEVARLKTKGHCSARDCKTLGSIFAKLTRKEAGQVMHGHVPSQIQDVAYLCYAHRQKKHSDWRRIGSCHEPGCGDVGWSINTSSTKFACASHHPGGIGQSAAEHSDNVTILVPRTWLSGEESSGAGLDPVPLHRHCSKEGCPAEGRIYGQIPRGQGASKTSGVAFPAINGIEYLCDNHVPPRSISRRPLDKCHSCDRAGVKVSDRTSFKYACYQHLPPGARFTMR